MELNGLDGFEWSCVGRMLMSIGEDKALSLFCLQVWMKGRVLNQNRTRIESSVELLLAVTGLQLTVKWAFASVKPGMP